MTALQQFLLTLLCLLATATAGGWGLALWEDSWALRIAATLLARVEGRRAYRAAHRKELARREGELGLPARPRQERAVKELDLVMGMGDAD